VNEQSWTNLSSVLWVEQPVGTGFSQGTPNIQNEDDLAAQLVGFMQQFLDVFSELKGKKLYLTGESVSIPLRQFLYIRSNFTQYAGTYVPCKWDQLYRTLLKKGRRYCKLYLREPYFVGPLIARDMDQRS